MIGIFEQGMAGASALERNVLSWIANERALTISGRTMALRLGLGVKYPRPECPRNAAEFDACARLLKAVPELREKLPLMADLSPDWRRLVDSWTALEAAQAAHSVEGGDPAAKSRAARKFEAMLQKALKAPARVH